MKTTHILILSSFLLCGCSTQKAVVQPAIHFVKAGEDTSWNQGSFILHVAKRHGNSLEGIRLVLKSTQGDEATWIADTGSVSSGRFTNSPSLLNHVADKDYVTVTLFNPQIIGHEQRGVRAEIFELRRFPPPNTALEPTPTAP